MSLIAVLIPLLFMGDIVGRLFREFAVTLSVTIVVSAIVSLTLTPMMCAKLLRHKPEAQQGRLLPRVGACVSNRSSRFYGKTLTFVLRHQLATLVVAVATLVATILLYIYHSQGLFPGAGYGRDSGRLRGAARRVVSSRWRSGSRRWST